MAITPSIDLDVQHITLGYTVNFIDKTDPNNPKPGSFSENVNLNLTNEAELNKVLTEKPFITGIAPTLANRIIEGYDAENAAAKALKDSIKIAVTPPTV